MSSKDRVVLAYSGGLDTSVAIGWIGEQTGREVVAVAVIVDRATGGERTYRRGCRGSLLLRLLQG